MNNHKPRANEPLHNQVAALMQHIQKYQFRGLSRLAKDAGVSKGTLSRFLRGIHTPTYATVIKVVAAFERALGKPLDPRQVVSLDRRFPSSPCELAGCSGCLPEEAFEPDGSVTSAFAGVKAGTWTAETVKQAKEANE